MNWLEPSTPRIAIECPYLSPSEILFEYVIYRCLISLLQVYLLTLFYNSRIITIKDRQSTVEPLALNVVYKKLEAGSNVLLKLHGICMIAAWMGCVGTGIIFARYFKTTWKVTTFVGTLPYTALGAQITLPPPLFLIFSFYSNTSPCGGL